MTVGDSGLTLAGITWIKLYLGNTFISNRDHPQIDLSLYQLYEAKKSKSMELHLNHNFFKMFLSSLINAIKISRIIMFNNSDYIGLHSHNITLSDF